MKKNVMMRLASFLLVAVLISTSAISGTYAKYVTEASGRDTARVAEWGVDISVSGSLFKQSYANDGTVEKDKTNADITNTVVVKSNSADNLVAPGTANSDGITFAITGTPEVAVNVNVQITDGATRDVYLADGEYLDWTTGNDKTDKFTLATPTGSYRPIVYTLVNDEREELAKGTLEDIETYLEKTLSGNYAANTNLATIAGGATGTYKLTWAWDFEQAANITLYDKADTLLGNLAAGKETSVDTAAYNLSANVEFSITVTQID